MEHNLIADYLVVTSWLGFLIKEGAVGFSYDIRKKNLVPIVASLIHTQWLVSQITLNYGALNKPQLTGFTP